MSALSINMHETDDDLVVTTPVPGLKPEEVEITITGDFLTIKGEYREKEEKKAKTFHLREQRFGTFHRSIGLPTRIETEKVKAEFEDGMLTITLPKAESAKPKTVTIKAK
jgi:HSP20 family protein